MTNTVSGIVSDETLSRIIHIESAGRPDAKAQTSSALGLGQFLKGTWLDVLKRHRPDLFNGPPYDDELALRTDPQLAIELLARFTEDNAAALGGRCSDGDLYLAHFAGVNTAKGLVRAAATTPASAVFSPQAIAANRSILEGRTCGEVRQWAARKMAGARGDWVAVYGDVPLPRPAPEREPRQIDPPDDDSDVQTSNPPPPRQPDDPGPQYEPAPPVGFFRRAWRKLTGWATGLGFGGLGALSYPELAAVVAATIVLLLVIAFFLAVWLFGKDRVREFVARQIRRMVPQ